MDDKPIHSRGRGFLNFLEEVTAGSPAPVQALVRQAIQSRNAGDLMSFYEIIDKTFADGLVNDLVIAAGMKMARDCEDHRVGNSSLENLIRHVAIMGVIAGAHFAKEKKL